MKLTPGQLVTLVVLLALLSFFVQFAIAKWLYERRRRRARDSGAPPRRGV
jgi:hypothetical protein